MTIGYLICLIAAVGLLIAYLLMVKNKELWLTLLYISIAVVNLGYFMMSLANAVAFAVFSNDVAYLGSVFLSMCMFFTIVRLCGFEIKKKHVITCVSLGAVMFTIIVSSPMLPLYYKSVDIVIIDGAAKLVKEYGVLHNAYLVYLLGYFGAMIGAIVHSVKKKKMGNPKLAGFIAAIVCSNLIVWLFEKLVRWEYEFLSVTYIISELLLVVVYWMMQDYVLKRDVPVFTSTETEQLGIDIAIMPMDVKIGKVLLRVREGEMLAPREREILEYILDNKKRRDIAALLCLSENTVKTYTRTLYSKLGVTGREELYGLLLDPKA
jgi:DNA-binding CsgD family transcriptional regulator